jgi:hypothetical protein
MGIIKTVLKASTQMKEKKKLKTKMRMKRMMMMKRKCLMPKMPSLMTSLMNREFLWEKSYLLASLQQILRMLKIK